ncbi:septum site-determining protein MinC [Pelomonas aquatica]|jgi:septum site-determining protein MinC|uniref:Probable septum site-determining protein MinC n=1 Tax=Pelomonas aquatica TaxID=431058 RepID=A0A9X4R4P1_9BURK|nr:septum site-determining protein MinC [Pelomonas aquatica]MCY4756172.1 septum site-determining protein MinC [Pelomonas aquatica]MDG0863457.1 septum site-determining protein MinC [Pelomonas aquatica]
MAETTRDSGGRNKGAARAGAFELKSRRFSLLGLVLHSADMAELAADWAERAGQGGFGHEPVVIDLSGVQRAPAAPAEGQAALALDGPAPVDLRAIVELLRASQLQPVAVAGATAEELALAHELGLADAADEPATERAVQAAPAETVREVVREITVEKIIEKPAAPAPTLVIDKPLRSGQQVYAKGGDLVVLAVVSHGAEVIADGSIHVYAPLRGKAIAGARGDTSARIYTQSLEAELLAIAGIYRTAENPLPADVAGKPAQVHLQGEKLLLQPLT